MVDGIRVSSGTVSVHNRIAFFNGGQQIARPATVCYSSVQGGATGCVGNIAFNPAFVGPDTLPEHPASSPISPCIDAGDPAVAVADGCSPPSSGSRRSAMRSRRPWCR